MIRSRDFLSFVWQNKGTMQFLEEGVKPWPQKNKGLGLMPLQVTGVMWSWAR